jgi:putative DNA-invertase from lambdoid prophage Rac
VQQTVERFQREGIRLVVLQLGNLDLTSSAGALMVKMLAAVADFERDLIIERTQAGQARARGAGKHMGRPSKTTPEQRHAIRMALMSGASVSSTALAYQVSRATIIAIRGACS